MVLRSCSNLFSDLFSGKNPFEADKHYDSDDVEEEPDVFKPSRDRRARARGLVRFLGNLFLHNLVREKMLQSILNGLVPPPDMSVDDSPSPVLIECACHLLGTIGEELVTTTTGREILASAIDSLDYWNNFHTFQASGSRNCVAYPSRIQYMMKNTIEVSQRWVAAGLQHPKESVFANFCETHQRSAETARVTLPPMPQTEEEDEEYDDEDEARWSRRVEQFISRYVLTEKAANVLRAAPSHVQQKVLARGEINVYSCNPSLAVLARVCDCGDVEAFITAHDLNDATIRALRTSPKDVQQKVLARGPIGDNVRNPSGCVMARVKEAQQQSVPSIARHRKAATLFGKL